MRTANWTGGVAISVATLAACGGGGGSPAINIPPTASGGPTQYVATGSNVTLTGTGVDAEGDPLTYAWTLNGAPLSTSSTATFQTGSAAAVYAPTLTVGDGKSTTQSTTKVFATPVGAALVEVGVASENLQPMPFTTTRNLNIIRVGSAPLVTVARFRVVTQGLGPFTIAGLTTQAPWNGIEASFGGLVEGQSIPPGTPVEFTLLATPTFVYREISHHWEFTVAETGQTFRFDVVLATTQ